ncbi:MAG: MFS transporter [SAR324 cluster bacterium]|nr:MFS transporter [SAR324 cluster bacterium]
MKLSNAPLQTDDASGSLLLILPLFLIFFLVFMDHLMLVPLGVVISKSIGLDPEKSGYLIAIYPIMAAFSALLSAPFSDRWGRKKMLLVLSFGFCLSTLGCALSYNVFTMFLFRILSAVFGGPIMPNTLAYAGDLFQGPKRVKAVTTVMLGFAASSILGVPFGAWTADTFSWQASFYIVAAATFLSIAGLYWMKPVKTGLSPGTVMAQYAELFKLWTLKKVRGLFYAQFFMLVGLFGLVPNLGVWMAMNMGMSATQVGLCYMQGGIGAIIGNQLSAYLIRRFSKAAVVSLGSIVMGIVVLLFTNLSFPPVLAGIFLAGMMFGGSIRMPAFNLILTETVPIYMRGRLMSMGMIVSNISMGFGGIWATPLLEIKDGRLYGMPIIGVVTLITTLLVAPMIYASKNIPAEVY